MTEQQLPPTQDDPPANAMPPPPLVHATGVPQGTVSGRPTAALVIGILLLVYGGINVLSLLFSAVQLANGSANTAMSPISIQIFSLAIAVVAVVLTIANGMGLIKMLPWARRGTIYSLLTLFALNMISTIVSLYFVQKMMPGMGEAARFAQIGMYIGFAMVFFIGGGATALFIVLLTRANVVQAFRHAGER